MITPPQWVADWIGKVCDQHSVPYPPFKWRQSKVNLLSSGSTRWNRTQVLVTAGTNLQDQQFVVLHELAHWTTIHRHKPMSSKGRGHTAEFWRIAFDLYTAHDLGPYAARRERGYVKALAEAERRGLTNTISLRDHLLAAERKETIMTVTEPKRYLSRPEVAERIGVQPDTLNRYKLPPPDAYVGQLPGWTETTIDAWNAARPGPGYRTDILGPRVTEPTSDRN